jgi:hypothetical protein
MLKLTTPLVIDNEDNYGDIYAQILIYIKGAK